MIERAADQTRTDDPLVNSQLNSNAEPHLNLLYHAELQRRTIQQIQAQNKCYGKLNSYGYFRTRVMNVIKVQNSNKVKLLFLLNICIGHQERLFGLYLSSSSIALYSQQSERRPPNLDLGR